MLFWGFRMPGQRMALLGIFAALLLSACGTLGLGSKDGAMSGGLCQCDAHAEQDLAKGLRFYEEGDYPSAVSMLQHALLDGLSSKSSQTSAYKYLAFIHCVSGREKQCRDAFKKALEIDPNLTLQAAEAGHPVWGPVFRSVKGSKPAP